MSVVGKYRENPIFLFKAIRKARVKRKESLLVGRNSQPGEHPVALASSNTTTHAKGDKIMAISGKYGKINIPNIGEEEPVFVLRAQDQLAVYAIEMYHLLTASHGASVSRSLDDEITTFKHWQGRKKMPD